MFSHLPPSGIDILLENEELMALLSKRKIGLLTNQSSLTKAYQPSAQVLVEKLGKAIKCLLTPEHGWSGFIGEGVKITHGFNSALRLPVLSLYGGPKTIQKDIAEMGINTLLIDLQDVGLRCYTYTATCAKLLEVCSEYPLDIIVCDRPNPLGPHQKGPLLDLTYRSIVGYLNIPFQHGQTIGDLLSDYSQTLMTPPLSFTVMSCTRDVSPYSFPWIPPSPNLPSWDAALLYPALVLLEGTNISEGRGTSLPFTCFGAPGLDNYGLVNFLNSFEYKGIRARPLTFTPQTGKLSGKECQGVHLLVSNHFDLDAFSLGINIIYYLKHNYSNFKWLSTKKENIYFIDYLLGTNLFRQAIDEGLSCTQALQDITIP